MGQIIIAIDGHSSCGKSTLARSLAQEFQYKHIDSGAMYRAVTYHFLEHKINIQDEDTVKVLLEDIDLQLENNSAASTLLYLNGRQLDSELRSQEVNHHVSQVASISAVRKKLVLIQREQGRTSGVVMDGRDIGTVVFPDAQLKLFLTADQKVRTKRRYEELQAKNLLRDLTWGDIEDNLRSRDEIDSNRLDSPLRVAEDAVVIDNSNLTRAEQNAMTACLARQRGA